MKINYPIIVDKGNDKEAWSIYVPDIKGCFSASDTEDGVLDNAREAILSHLSLLDNVPEPTPLSKVEADSGTYTMLVDIDLTKLEGKAKRINITVPENLLAKIDLAAEKQGVTRSAFLTESALKAI